MADADSLLDPYDDEEKAVGYGVGEDALLPPAAEGIDDLDAGRAAQQVGDISDAAAARVGDLPPTTLADPVDTSAAPDLMPPGVTPSPESQGVNSTVSPTSTPVEKGGTVAGTNPTAEEIAGRQAVVDKERARVAAQVAQQQAADAKEAQREADLERADYLQRRSDAERDLAARTKAYEGMKIENPRERTNSVKSALAVIFGGLGAAFRSAGGGSSENTGLAALEKKWQEETEIQKANIAAARDQTIAARTRLDNIDEGRRMMQRDADARLLSKYNLAIKQGEAQLRNQGLTQADIDADNRIVQLRQNKAIAEQKARAAEDEHALKQARAAALKAQAERRGTPDDLRTAQIRVMNARAGLLERKAKGGGGGGGGGGAGAEAVTKHLLDNPGDLVGARAVARKNGVSEKVFDKVVAQTKGTEGQNKNAHQAKVGLDAVNAIEASGYTPNKADIQKWLNNSRLVHLADKEGIVGGGAALAQTFGAIPQSEVEGLSPEAAAYFGNVRRYMETIGRAQSGAAISPSEWTNFFNQYGPNSKGGLEAARQYLRDQFKLSGVAGRTLTGGGGTPEVAIPEPTPEELGRMRKAKARGIHDFDEIIERYRGK